MAKDDESVKDKKRAAGKERDREMEAPKKTNLGDSATIKRIMDDAVIQVSVARPNGGLGVVAPTQPLRNDRRWCSTSPTRASTMRRTPR